MKTKISPLGWMAFVVLVVGIVSLTVWTANTRKTASQPASAAATAEPISDVSADSSMRPRASGASLAEMTPEQTEARRAAQRQEQKKVAEAGRSKLFNQYQSERVDGSWAVAKEQTLETLSTSPQIQELNAKPKAVDVHCRSSVCLVTADFPTKLAADDWFTLYTMNVGQEMPNVSLQRTTNPDGTIHLELYGLAR